MAPHARNHVVTRAHLDLFARDGLVACHFDTGDVKTLTPTAIAVRKDFYVIKDGEGGRDTSLERAMSQPEASAVEALRRVREWPLDEADRTAITEYLALLALRSPAFRAWHSAKTQALLAEDRTGPWLDLPQDQWGAAADYFSGSGYWHETMMRLLSRVGSLLGSMHWTLMRFSGPRVCISDQPLVCVPLLEAGQFRPFQPIPDAGFANVIEVRVPVDSRHALLLSWHDEVDDGPAIVADRQILRDLNASIVAQADRQWFHRPGATPPHAPTVHVPLAMQLIPGYGPAAAQDSRRRKTALSSVNEITQQREPSQQMKITRVRHNVA